MPDTGGLRLRYPRTDAHWEVVDDEESGQKGWLVRAKPAEPGLAVKMAIRGDLPATACGRFLEEQVKGAAGRRLETNPAFLPPGFHPTVMRHGTAGIICGDAGGLLAVVVFEVAGGPIGPREVQDLRAMLEAMRTSLASAPRRTPTAAAATTDVRLASTNLTVALPNNWKYTGLENGDDVLVRVSPDQPRIRIDLWSRYLYGRDCDYVLDTGGSMSDSRGDGLLKHWNTRVRAARTNDMAGFLFCVEPREDEIVSAKVLVEGDLRRDETAAAALQAAVDLLDPIGLKLRDPGWRAANGRSKQLVLPKSGLTIRLPDGTTEWDHDPSPGSQGQDWIRRMRPAKPTLAAQVSIRRDLSPSQCARYIDETSRAKPGGSTQYSPAFLPASGWHTTVGRLSPTVGLVCGPSGLDVVLVSFVYEGDFNSPDLLDLKVLLERISEAVGPKPSVATSSSSSSSTTSTASAGSSSSAASSSGASSTVATPDTTTDSPSSYSYEDSGSFFDFIDLSDAELGGIDYTWYAGAMRTGLDAGDSRYGAILGTNGFVLDDEDDWGTAFRYDLWAGYGPTDGFAFEGTMAFGFGPVEEDEWAVTALAGFGFSRWSEALMPLNVLGVIEARARVKGEVFGLEGAFGRYFSSAESSNRLELRLFFPLGEDSTWVLGWRHGMYPNFAQDLVMLGHEW